jgi:4-hydroxy-tetrahydrodipicolinate reductase
MGQRILAQAVEKKDVFSVVGAIERSGHPFVGCAIKDVMDIKDVNTVVSESLKDVIKNSDVVIDFSSIEGSLKNVEICRENNVPVVVGTTGFSAQQRVRFKDTSKKIAMVVAPNMSVGVNLLFNLASKVAQVLDDEFDIEIVEAHHRFKKDAPSGTAQRLAEVVADARKVDLDEKAVYGREGVVGQRQRGEIGIHAVRMGSVIGDHTVSFANLVERVELTHKAQSRDTFAIGALTAARFVVKAECGLYDMQDVLGLK